MKGLGGEHINFVVPDKKTLVALDTVPGLGGSTLKPGVIEPILDLFKPGDIVKLAVDGKKLNVSTEQDLGRVDLWG